MARTTLAINFFAEDITVALRNEFMDAVDYEAASMNIQMLEADIARLNTQVTNLKNNQNKTEEEKAVALADLEQKIEDKTAAVVEFKSETERLQSVYDKVITTMSQKNKDGYGNSKDVVRTVLRVLGSWNNSKLTKYAIIPAFESPALHDALETIHILSKADENGAVIMSDDVKAAYKKVSAELETIIKVTFSLPFETSYTSKTRVKLTAEDKKLLNDCYIKSFRNKYDIDEETGKVSFKKRQINTLVKGKMNKQTKKMEYDYSALASTISEIVIKHYFAD
jgi:hypothetical protein